MDTWHIIFIHVDGKYQGAVVTQNQLKEEIKRFSGTIEYYRGSDNACLSYEEALNHLKNTVRTEHLL